MIAEETDLQRMADACNRAAKFYREHPNTAGPETIIDIYCAMAALAAMLDTQAREAPLLQSKKLH